MYPQKKWYVVYTQPGCEKKVTGSLARKNVEHFCPINKVRRRFANNKVITDDPLIASYVFVRTTYPELEEIKKIKGISNVVYWLTEPAVIRNDEIDTLKMFMHQYHNVKAEKILINPGEEVNSSDSHLAKDHEPENRSNMVRAHLPSLGYVLIAVKQTAHVEKSTEYGIKNRYVRFLRLKKTF